MPLALSASPAEKADEEAEVVETLDIEYLFQAMAVAQDYHGGAVVHTSPSIQVQRRRLSRISRTLAGTLRCTPTQGELFAARREKVKAFIFTEHPLAVVSLDVPIGEDGDQLFKEMK